MGIYEEKITKNTNSVDFNMSGYAFCYKKM